MDMGRKLGGRAPLGEGELGPHLIQCGLGRGLRHFDPSNRLATIHQRHVQTDRTGQIGQRSDCIERTVLQTVAQNRQQEYVYPLRHIHQQHHCTLCADMAVVYFQFIHSAYIHLHFGSFYRVGEKSKVEFRLTKFSHCCSTSAASTYSSCRLRFGGLQTIDIIAAMNKTDLQKSPVHDRGGVARSPNMPHDRTANRTSPIVHVVIRA